MAKPGTATPRPRAWREGRRGTPGQWTGERAVCLTVDAGTESAGLSCTSRPEGSAPASGVPQGGASCPCVSCGRWLPGQGALGGAPTWAHGRRQRPRPGAVWSVSLRLWECRGDRCCSAAIFLGGPRAGTLGGALGQARSPFTPCPGPSRQCLPIVDVLLVLPPCSSSKGMDCGPSGQTDGEAEARRGQWLTKAHSG